MSKIFSFILDLIFPIRCLACAKEGDWLCPGCFEKIKFQESQSCPVCRKERKGGRLCPACQKKKSIDGLLIACHYQDKIVQNIIHLLKYKYVRGLKPLFGRLLAEFIKRNDLGPFENYFILPIPLHKKRERFRGFNQAEIIAEELAKILKIPVRENVLRRQRHTSAQAKLKARQRAENIKNAFILASKLEKTEKSAILIDDVYTTGSTMNEAAKVLKKGGVKEVIGLVIARG